MSADSFADLDLPEPLVQAAARVGLERPTPLQDALIPVVRRGGNAVVVGGSGSGARTGILLALLARLLEEETPQADGDTEGPARPRLLILTGTRDAADEVAVRCGRMGRGTGLRCASLRNATARTTVAAGTADSALSRVRASELKLDALEAVLVDGFDAVRALDRVEELDAVMGLVEDVQRVVRADTASDALDQYATRAVRRALRIPARSAEPAVGGSGALAGVNLSVVELGHADPADAVADIAGRTDGPLLLYLRVPARGDDLEVELQARGLDTAPGDDGGALRVGRGDAEPTAVSVDVPASADELGRRHAQGGYVVVRAAELPHLRAIANEVGANLEPAPMRRGEDPHLARFRERVRRALQEEDLGAQALVLEPLLRERPASEVAAALSALLRSDRPAAADAEAPAAGRGVEEGVGQGVGSGKPAAPPTSTHLYMSIGERDGVRPGDLVGAITGEAGVSGDKVGRIDIRDNFSVVEVETPIARRVIDALNGKTVKGRSVRVDYDRREGGEAERKGGGARPPGDRGGRGGPGGGRGGPDRGGPRGRAGGARPGGGRAGGRGGGSGGRAPGGRGRPEGGRKGGGRTRREDDRPRSGR